jgi:hypothetical protein
MSPMQAKEALIEVKDTRLDLLQLLRDRCECLFCWWGGWSNVNDLSGPVGVSLHAVFAASIIFSAVIGK